MESRLRGDAPLVIDNFAGSASTVDPAELKHFAAAADIWWDADGIARWIHSMNPMRVDYTVDVAARALDRPVDGCIDGLRILDLGCGAGVMSEPLVERGGVVTGIDPAQSLIDVAKAHASQRGLAIDYRCTTPEALAQAGETFDVVVAYDVVEHVADAELFLRLCASLTAPDGVLIVSTMNRTIRSFLQAIVIGEYVLRFLPRGSHNWKKFIKPREIKATVAPLGLRHMESKGLTMDLRRWRLRISDNVAVTYFIAFRRAAD